MAEADTVDYLRALIEGWRARPLKADETLRHRAPSGHFRTLAILASDPQKLPEGVSVIALRGMPAHTIRLRIDGLGDVTVTGAHPEGPFALIADAAGRIVEMHARGADGVEE